jgi:hypothetical protein
LLESYQGAFETRVGINLWQIIVHKDLEAKLKGLLELEPCVGRLQLELSRLMRMHSARGR